MKLKCKFILISVAALLATSCAGRFAESALPPAPVQGAWLVDHGAAPTPHGAAELCARAVSVCGPSATETQPGTEAMAGPAALSNDASGAASLINSAPDGAAVFQLLLAQQARRFDAASGAPSDARRLDEAAWRQLVGVNAEVNWAIRPATDEEIYGRSEVWALPLSAPSPHGARRGDCEDYALEKRARLLALGWGASTLSIAMAQSPATGLHAVLIAHTDRGDIVLDNLHEAPLALQDAPYSWLSEQKGTSLSHWVSVAAAVTAEPDNAAEVAAPALEAASRPNPAAGGPEALFASLIARAQDRALAQEQALQTIASQDMVQDAPLVSEADLNAADAAFGALSDPIALRGALDEAPFRVELIAPETVMIEAQNLPAQDMGQGLSRDMGKPAKGAAIALRSDVKLGAYSLSALFAEEILDRRLEAPSMKQSKPAIAGFCSPKSTQP